MKNFSILFYILLFSFLLGAFSAQASTPLNAYFFYGDGCPHCEEEQAYLQTVQTQYPDLEIRSFEIYHNTDNALLLKKIIQTLDVDISGVPFLIIGNKYFVGYADGITSSEIENRIKECSNSDCSDSIVGLLGISTEKQQDLIQEEQNQIDITEKIINIPILGNVNINKFSLPLFTIVMGILDGFNPCAMWTLLFLISLLLGMKNRKRMWILGIAFIVASASVYFIFMAAWLNLILFLGFVVWVRIVIGLLALFGGGYSLKEFLFNKNGGCQVANNERRQKVFQKLKSIISQNRLWLALGGIIVLAFMVNLIELICSAGLPAIYTQVLALNDLTGWQHYLYILLYIFFFMLDDLFVFFVAMITLEMTGVTTKYVKYSRLAGGLLMLLIGLLLIFKPQWLMFG